MPAWSREWTGLKTVIVKTDNAAKNLPTVQASYLLIRNDTGETVAIMDGTELTRRRTAAASALAADYLARPDASALVLVGAGALGSHFVRAHAAVRPIRKVFIYNRSFEKAAALAGELKSEGFEATAVADLEAAVRQADIVSCVTTTRPVVRANGLNPAPMDLAGRSSPPCGNRWERCGPCPGFVDTREGALSKQAICCRPAMRGSLISPMSRAISLTSAGAP
jgi:ornithine cyclodeaminase